jgi:hypothetical protein
VKLGPVRKGGGGREELRERQRRDRSLAPAMRSRYPQFSSLRLECDFSDDAGAPPAPHVMVLHPPAAAFFVFPCPYSDCDGEFDLTAAVAELARDQDSHCEGQMRCAGHRVRDRNGRTPCQLTLEYSVHATLEKAR